MPLSHVCVWDADIGYKRISLESACKMYGDAFRGDADLRAYWTTGCDERGLGSGEWDFQCRES